MVDRFLKTQAIDLVHLFPYGPPASDARFLGLLSKLVYKAQARLVQRVFNYFLVRNLEVLSVFGTSK